MLDLSIRANVRDIERTLSALERHQLPFATARGLSIIAKFVQKEEQKGLRRRLDRPTPFTVKAVGMKGAKKNDLVATVFVRDIAASYLEPFEFGGKHKMIGRGRTWINPKNGLTLNQYGNLSRNKLRQLKSKPGVFVGKVKTKGGDVIDGVWQRPYIRSNQKLRGMSRMHGLVNRHTNTSGRLKLLARFGDPLPVRQHLDYRKQAHRVIARSTTAALRRGLAEAMRSSR